MKTEATPLVPDAEAPNAGMFSAGYAFVMKFAAAFAIVFYITVAVVKTMLTKVLLNSASTPVALSATSCWVTCVMLIPVFVISPKTWGVLNWRKNGMGFAMVTVLVTLDLAFTNISMSLLALAVQQCILAVNPAFTVIIESVVKRRLAHPIIYLTITVLCIGPVITNIGPKDEAQQVSIGGIISQLFGCFNSACKYVFAHSVMQECKKDLGSFAFLFWLDAATLIILIPWAFIDGSMIQCYRNVHTGLDAVKLFGSAILGGLRFFSQLIVLRVTTPTNLSCANICFQAINIYLSLALFHDTKIDAYLFCGTGLTLLTSGVYTYWKISKVLTKKSGCIKLDQDFKACVNCGPRAQTGDAPLPYSKA